MSTQQITELTWALIWPTLTFIFLLGLIIHIFYNLRQGVRTENYKLRRLYDKLIFTHMEEYEETDVPNPDPQIGDRYKKGSTLFIWDGLKWVKI